MQVTYRIWCDINLEWTRPDTTEIKDTEDPEEIATEINRIHEVYLNNGPPPPDDDPEFKVTRATGNERRGIAWLEGSRGHVSAIIWGD